MGNKKDSSLRQRAASGVIWSTLQRLGQMGITFVIGLVMARLLMPADYGLIGMLFIFIAVSGVFVESGFGAALVQRQSADHTDYCTVFYFNLLISAACYAALFAVAPLVSAFYTQPLLTTILRVFALKIILDALCLVPRTILYKTLAFRQIAIADGVSLLVSGIIGVFAALSGLSVWSLVLQQLSAGLLNIFLFHWYCPWHPGLVFSLPRLRQLFSYGSKLLGASLLQRLFDNIYGLAIGKYYAADALGYYGRAQQLEQIPARALSVGISQVTFPLFSEIQHDKERLRRSVRKALMLGAFVVFPALIGLAVIAEPFVRVVLTDKWLPCVPYVRLFCLLGMGYPLRLMNQNVLRSTGRSDQFLYVELISKTLLLVFLCVTLRYGIIALLIGQVVHTWIMWCVLAFLAGRIIDYGPWDQFWDIAPIMCAAILMGVAVYAMGVVLPGAVLRLLLLPAAGAIAYAALAFGLRLRIFGESLGILRERIGIGAWPEFS